jgi:hypothetical protein
MRAGGADVGESGVCAFEAGFVGGDVEVGDAVGY